MDIIHVSIWTVFLHYFNIVELKGIFGAGMAFLIGFFTKLILVFLLGTLISIILRTDRAYQNREEKNEK